MWMRARSLCDLAINRRKNNDRDIRQGGGSPFGLWTPGIKAFKNVHHEASAEVWEKEMGDWEFEMTYWIVVCEEVAAQALKGTKNDAKERLQFLCESAETRSELFGEGIGANKMPRGGPRRRITVARDDDGHVKRAMFMRCVQSQSWDKVDEERLGPVLTMDDAENIPGFYHAFDKINWQSISRHGIMSATAYAKFIGHYASGGWSSGRRGKGYRSACSSAFNGSRSSRRRRWSYTGTRS
jgi:hypothetical protein